MLTTGGGFLRFVGWSILLVVFGALFFCKLKLACLAKLFLGDVEIFNSPN